MATPLQRAAQIAAKSSGTLRAQKVAELAKVLADPDPPLSQGLFGGLHPNALPTSKVVSTGGGSKVAFTNDGLQYIDVPSLQYPKPLPYNKHTQAVQALINDGIVTYDPSSKSYWHGDTLVAQGNVGPYAPHTHGLVTLVNTYKPDGSGMPTMMGGAGPLWNLDGKSSAMTDDAGKQWDVAGPDPFAEVPELDPNSPQIAAIDAALEGWLSTETPRKGASAYADVARQPGESVREYVARLKELQRDPGNASAVAEAVRSLEARLADHVKRGRIGPNGGEARQGRWKEWLGRNDSTLYDKWDEARDALVSKNVLRRNGESVVGSDGTVYEDADGLYHRDKLQQLASYHLDDKFFGGDNRKLASDTTEEYLDYLSANGVDQRTIDAIRSGELPMDSQSRAARATEMGLDAGATWFRLDTPLKTEFKGWTGAALSKPEFSRSKRGALSFIDLSPSKEGLVYTSHSPKYAEVGVQVPLHTTISYPLFGPSDGIAGIDRLPESAYDDFRAKQAEALLRKHPADGDPNAQAANGEMRRTHQRKSHLAEPLASPSGLEVWHNQREHSLRELRDIDPDTKTRQYETVPHFRTAEDRKLYLEPLMSTGAKGTLVRDETGISTAFTPAGARELRRADLAPLDPRFKFSRNILQSLLVPVVVGAASSQQSKP